MCAWMKAADSVIVGRITNLEFSSSRPVTSDGAPAPACAATSVVPAIHVSIDVEQVLSGRDLTGRAVTLKYSAPVQGHWEPRPVPDGESILWWGKDAETERLLIGQQVGALLYDIDGDLTSVFEPFFAERDGALVVARSSGLCDLNAPSSAYAEDAPSSINELAASLEKCATTAEARARADAMRLALANPCCDAVCSVDPPDGNDDELE